MSKITTVKEAAALIKDGATILLGGFYALGTPIDLIEAIIAQGTKNLTIITNDTSGPGEGPQLLIDAGCVKKLVATYIGLTPDTPSRVERGELELEIVPQGTLAERIRCGGFGLGGVLTPTGLGTIIEEQKQVLELNGKRWIYDTPIKADFAIVEAYQADTVGNLVFRRTQNNFCTVMCSAADTVIASIVEPIVAAGTIDPDHVMVPGILVDLLVRRGV